MNLATKIFIIDDEPEIRIFLSASLEAKGFHVTALGDATSALRLMNAKPADLIILDLGLPDKDGQDVLKELRTWSSVPIIILSARDRETEKVTALENGADDYLTKPFGIGELLARIKVALRHTNRIKGLDDAPYIYQGLKIDLANRLVTLNGHDLRLTPTEYKLLAELAKTPGKVVTQSMLIHAVWGKNSQGNSHYLRIYVQHLRTKLNDDPLDPSFIFTEPGVGYRLAVA